MCYLARMLSNPSECWGLTPHLSFNGKASSGHLRIDKVTGVVLPRPFDRMLLRRGACFLCPDSCDGRGGIELY